MYPSVAAAFWDAVSPIEGICLYPYVDDKGLVTCAMGYLVDDGTGVCPQSMLDLPWYIEGASSSGTPTKATYAQIRAGWQAVKARQDLKGTGGGTQADLSDLRLTNADARQTTSYWLAQAEPNLRKSFPQYEKWPADAQLGVLNMSYGLGSAFGPYAADPRKRYPKFCTAVNAVVPNFTVAAIESAIADPGSAIEEHNALSFQCFSNAAAAQHANVPFSVLWWPGSSPPTGTAADSMARAALAASAPYRARATAGRVAGGMILGGVLAGVAWAAVAGYRSHERGGAWTRPLVDVKDKVARAEQRLERGIDTQVRRLLPRGAR